VAKSRRSRRTLTLIVLVVISLSIISLDLNGRTHSVTSGVKSVANGVFSPLRGAVVDLLSPIGSFFAGAVHYGSLQSENEKLSAALGNLKLQKEEKGFEATQLRTLLALEHLPFLNALSTVTAQTTQVNTSNFTMTITVDKGRADGIQVGMPVVGAGGLVGQVIQAFHHSSVVELITDGQSKVAVVFGSGTLGLVDGQGPADQMTADLVPPHASGLHKGVIMYTSGQDAAAFPPGIPVAKVKTFHASAGASQESISLEPEANMSQLAYVDIVVWAPPPSPDS
jgi:rod shape-determining protein MreC